MSIIIKGMKMPENCVDCDIVHREENAYGDTLGFTCQLIYKGYIHDKTGRLPECPLVELPPHGRLIDADELIEQINQSIAEQEKVFDSIKEDPIGKQSAWVDIMHDERIVRILRDAPTIIEAEEAEK